MVCLPRPVGGEREGRVVGWSGAPFGGRFVEFQKTHTQTCEYPDPPDRRLREGREKGYFFVITLKTPVPQKTGSCRLLAAALFSTRPEGSRSRLAPDSPADLKNDLVSIRCRLLRSAPLVHWISNLASCGRSSFIETCHFRAENIISQ